MVVTIKRTRPMSSTLSQLVLRCGVVCAGRMPGAAKFVWDIHALRFLQADESGFSSTAWYEYGRQKVEMRLFAQRKRNHNRIESFTTISQLYYNVFRLSHTLPHLYNGEWKDFQGYLSHVSAYFKMKGCKELKHVWIFRSWWRITLSLLALALITGLCLLHFSGVSTKAAGVPAHRGVIAINFQGQSYSFVQGAVQPPPTDKQCRKSLGIPCYNPFELRRAYNVDGLLSMGDDGSGQTIIIVDSFGSPTIQRDLHAFDQAFGIPDPPSFKIYTPLGTKPFDPNNGNMIGWAAETTLDVEWAHAMAPGANIALMTSPVNETQGVQGMPQFLL